MFFKLGENLKINRIEDTNTCTQAISQDILDDFKKMAGDIKRVAPKADDFLYFSAIMMHAAESAAINDDGSPKFNKHGEEVKVGWDKTNDTWKWVSNDPFVMAFKNNNGDIFPEEELIKAHKKWIGKPLCVDHKSSSAEFVRGLIVDTYYDRVLKRVVALCALDKAGYPQLARQVSTGVSNNVSMGVGVGRAICYDCAKVARMESDFCNHMKTKSSYGEINVDLNPIELSIVVNGADPKAHIKHIIAADLLNRYVDNKQSQLNKLAATSYHATFSVSENNDTTNDLDSHQKQITINNSNIESFKMDVENAIKQLEDLNKSFENDKKDIGDTNDEVLNHQSSGTLAMQEGEMSNTDFGLAPPSARFASLESSAEFSALTKSIEEKLNKMQESINKLANVSQNTQEENMSGSKDLNKQGYYQGTEDPSPGQPKYQKDPLNEKLRTDGDKQMETQDLGPIDGLAPGDLDRKKLLARAEAEERAMKRTAVVNLAKKALENKKEGYWHGAGGVNEPTPGKQKYPVDKLNEQVREEDKHMVGQKPFPGVGSVDGLHPSPSSADISDEKKRKEFLQRASLKAVFNKASNNDGSRNLGKSAWDIFLGDKLILTASVGDLSGGRSEMMYDTIATKPFGASLLEKVKVFGAEQVKSLFKSAQDPNAAAPTPAPEMPMPDAGTPPDDVSAPVEDTGKDGDPKESALDLAEKVRDVSSDLVEAVRALTGEKSEMGEEPAPVPAKAASDGSFSTSALNAVRRELNGSLIHAMKESIADLQNHEQELDMIVGIYDKGADVASSNTELLGPIVEDALSEAKSAVADGMKLMTAFVKYARGSKAIVKRAEIEAELNNLADGDDMASDETMNLVNDTDDEHVEHLMDEDVTGSDSSGMAAFMKNELAKGKSPDEIVSSIVGDEDGDEDLENHSELDEMEEMSADDNDAKFETPDGAPMPKDLPTGTKIASLNSKEGRAALRAKLAADTVKMNSILHDAHPKGGFTTELDVKPEGDLAMIEDLEETHDAMLDLANAPARVRKEAESIHKLVSEGKVQVSELDALVAEGLDKDAVAYYKKYFSQTDGGSEFASELVKEHVKAKMEEDLNSYKIKLGRAYELAYDMVSRGLCHNDRLAITKQVEDIMAYNDASFDSLKRVVASSQPVMTKEARRIPSVGVVDSGEYHQTESGSLYDQLSAAFNVKTPKRMF